MRRKTRIKEIIAAIDSKVHDRNVAGDQLLKDALYNYRDTLVEEFYQISSKPKTDDPLDEHPMNPINQEGR